MGGPSSARRVPSAARAATATIVGIEELDDKLRDTLLGQVTPGKDVEHDVTRERARALLFSRARPLPRVGRFVILSHLGEGGMGVVFSAYDEELDRKVAVKLLQPGAGGSEGFASRLRREAQAMARINHPNVVAVHEVGRHEDGLYVAMEFVRGETLRTWLGEERSIEEIVGVFVDAARGLHAAHTHGLTHRDFKPENAMLGEDGRVRVLDFGLATLPKHSVPEIAVSTEDGVSTKPADVSLTSTGQILGTPAYMSPEQLEGKVADARSDQFSFCVALYEALWRQRPFPGDSVEALALSVTEHRIREPPAGKVPVRLRTAVVRGLAVDPDDRWPSMEELIGELQGVVQPRSRRSLWVVAGVAVAGGGLALGLSRDETCAPESFAAPMEQIWNADRRAAIGSAFAATGLGFADATWAHVEQHVERYATRWQAQRRTACEQLQAGLMSTNVHDASVACLERDRELLAALLEVFEDPGEDTVERAPAAVEGLSAVERCGDAKYVLAQVPPPDDLQTARRVDEVRRGLARAEALVRAGRFDDAVAEAQARLDEARATGYEPVAAEAEFRLGFAHSEGRSMSDAVEPLERAFFAARRVDHEEVVARAAVALMFALGVGAGKVDEGKVWGRHAEASLAQIDDDAIRGQWLNNRGVLARRAGDADQALLHFEAALQLIEGQENVELRLAVLESNRGLALADANRHPEALRAHERALELRLAALGEDHPFVAAARNNLSLSLYSLGREEEAQREAERSLEIKRRAYGPEHPSVANALVQLGNAHHGRKQYTKAFAAFEEALRIQEKHYGANDHRLGAALANLAYSAARLRNLDEARDFAERSLAVRRAGLGAEHPEVIASMATLASVKDDLGDKEGALRTFSEALAISERVHDGDVVKYDSVAFNASVLLHELGRNEEALPLCLRVLAARETTFGRDHPKLFNTLRMAGLMALELGRLEEARPLFERVRDLADDSLQQRFEVEQLMSMLLWKEGRRDEATAAHDRALTIVETAAPERHEPSRANMHPWPPR